jgi:hypothetical protein
VCSGGHGAGRVRVRFHRLVVAFGNDSNRRSGHVKDASSAEGTLRSAPLAHTVYLLDKQEYTVKNRLKRKKMQGIVVCTLNEGKPYH